MIRFRFCISIKTFESGAEVSSTRNLCAALLSETHINDNKNNKRGEYLHDPQRITNKNDESKNEDFLALDLESMNTNK